MNRITRKVILFLYCISVILCANSVGTNLAPAYLPTAEQVSAENIGQTSDMVKGTDRISYSERFSTICYSTTVERLSNEIQRNSGSTRLVSSVRIPYARFFHDATLFNSHQLSINRSFNTYNTAVLAKKLSHCKLDYRLMNSYFSDYI
mgnify:FL=1